MMHDIFFDVESVGASLLQVVILFVLTPFFVWALDYLPHLASGRSVVSVWRIYKRFVALTWSSIWEGLFPKEGLVFSLVIMIFFAIPGCSLMMGADGVMTLMPMEDPLLIGGLIMVAGVCLMPTMIIGRYVGAAFVLCISEALLEVAAPGVNGLVGVNALLQLTPGSGLAGTSVCCALALAVMTPLPAMKELTQYLLEHESHQNRERRDQNRLLLGFLQMGWLLLVADLLLPVLIKGHGWVSFIELIVRLIITLVIMIFLKLMGVERSLHIVALLIGLGLLIALAGRFAT